MRTVRLPLSSTFAPEQALLALRGDVRPFALVGDWAGGGALVGSQPTRILAADDDPLEVLDDMPAVSPGAHDGVAVGGGWIGWLGYGAAAHVERTVAQPPRPVPLPLASWAFYDHLLRLDAQGRWWFEALWGDEESDRLAARHADLERRLTAPPPTPRPVRTTPFVASPGEGAHAAAVEQAKAYIAAGDLYQANLTLRLEAAVAGEAIDLFAQAAATLRPARGAFVGDPHAQVASLSPELFLERRGRRVRTAPIKGTVQRTGDPAEADRLRASAKDAAEHVMIVDLMRNDLGRVGVFGSIEAPDAPRAEAHPGVWHLVSDVRASLRADISDADLLRATFPPGSVTGAPKLKALEVIATLESTGREVYTGAIGFCSPLAGLELNVAIRTFEVAGGRVWLGVGGGVVADSDPGDEVGEAVAKAGPLIAAAGGELAAAAPPTPTPGLPPIVRTPRPDPAAGLLETLLAVDGHVVELDRHVARLAASALDVLGRPLDRPVLVARILEAATGATAERPRRIRVVAGGDGRVTVTAEPVDPARILPAHPVTLVPVTLPGGAGGHKWADRRLLDAQRGDREMLVVDLDGRALETGRGTLWIAEGERLVTPPADGRILAGTVRALLLAAANSRAEPIDLARVEAADAVLVTSSIRGVQAAHLHGRPAPVEIPSAVATVAGRLAAAWGVRERAPA